MNSYSPFRGRWDSKWSLECKTKSQSESCSRSCSSLIFHGKQAVLLRYFNHNMARHKRSELGGYRVRGGDGHWKARKKGRIGLNCTPSKSRPHQPILLLSVFNSVQLWQVFLYLSIFDLKDYFLDLYLYLIFGMSTISRFWICWNSSFLMQGIFF